MLYRPPLRLRTRFILSSTALITLLMVIVVFFVERRQTQVLMEQAQEHGASLAQAVADLSIRYLQYSDIVGLQQNMERAAEDPDVVYAIIFNRDAEALASNQEARELFPPELFEMGAEMGRLEQKKVLMGTVFFDTAAGRNMEILEVVAPVVVDEENTSVLWGAVRLGLSLSALNAEIHRTRIGLISLGFLGLTFGTLGAVFLAKRISSPLETLVEGTVKVAQGDLQHRIRIAPGDEIGELAANFNRMTAQILEDRRRLEETSHKLIEAEKLATMGRLAAAMAHEIRNPLTAIKLNIQKVGHSPALSPLERAQIEIAESGIRQVERIVKEILSYARAPKLAKDFFQLENLVEDALRFAEDQLDEKRVSVVKEYTPELPALEVDGDKLRQVFLNILLNSVEAVRTGGRITVRTSITQTDGERQATIEFEDNGSGIGEKDLRGVFEPFFTTKSLGTGLGLTNARRVVELHRGRIEIASKVSVGTRVTIRLPYENEPATAVAAGEDREHHEIHSGH